MVHTKLDVWKKAMILTTNIYKITTKFPKSEKYALASQIRRSAVSIPSNIAEGAGRFSSKEFTRFLHFAMGSIAELETQLLISADLNYITDKSNHLKSLDEIRKCFMD
jgi:four helix bundle protein